MTNECVYCGLEVKDFEPIYCCGGQDCGCYGLPIEPPTHQHCEIIDFLKKLKSFCKNSKDISISMTRSFPGVEVKLENHTKVVSSEDITLSECQYVMDCQGYVSGVNNFSDYLIEQLGGSTHEENPEKINSRTEILDL